MYPDVTISVKKLNDGQEYIARTTSIVERESVVEEIRCSSPDVKLDQDGSAIIMYQWMSGGESGPMPFFPEGRRIAFEDIILSPTVSSDRSMISLDTKSFYMRLPTGWLNGTIIRFRKSNDTIRDASPEEENMLTQRSTLMLVTIASSDRPITLVSSTLDAETANSDGPAGVSE
ncbi:MAG: hypothetical protein LBF24_00430 [Puniceicoccales bacterium]|nr:hypothetical protein [Puniceicoccales bacterium]